MAAPINAADLEKLKKFIEFVAANPFVLNLPQLEFMKKFIEKFGGKVPEGEFQMPSGGKCPFGGAGDATKSETKETEAEDEKPAEMDVESEESDVELDMEENQQNINIFEPNIVYLEEKPPKIVKAKFKTAKVKAKQKRAAATKKPKKLIKKTGTKAEKKKIKTTAEHYKEDESKCGNFDPLFTSNLNIKEELSENELTVLVDPANNAAMLEENDSEIIVKHSPNTDFKEQNFVIEEMADFSESSDDEYDHGKDKEDSWEQSSSDSDDEDDEPLIMLSSASKGGGGGSAYKSKKIRAPKPVKCRIICRQGCADKFSEKQRLRICNYFWTLGTKEQKYNYLRKNIKIKTLIRSVRIHRGNRGHNCCYYLQDIEPTTLSNQQQDELSDQMPCEQIRVCRKYFEATLCITSHLVKKALHGVELEVDHMPYFQPPATKETEISKEKKEYLDPETGNLTVIEPNSKPTISAKPKPTDDDGQQLKKKRRRRKPGEPEHERFPRPVNCEERCIFKCHEKFTEQERKQICDVFWSMDYKRRKDFLLSRIETTEVLTQTTAEYRKTTRPNRTFHTRFFLRHGINGENKRVCKKFLSATLVINRTFISNAIEFADKVTGNYTGSDGRGKNRKNPPVHQIRQEERQIVRDHLSSFPTWIPNKKANTAKTRYLHYDLTIKLMHADYKLKCTNVGIRAVCADYFRKIFHEDFHLSFLKHPNPNRKGRGIMARNPNISDYTGEEPGGIWFHPNGEKLDLNRYRVDRSVDSSLNVAIGSSSTTTTVTAAETIQHSTSATMDSISQSSMDSVHAQQQQQQPQNLAFYSNPFLLDANLMPNTSSMFRMF